MKKPTNLINLNLEQIEGLVFHLNESLYRQSIPGDNPNRIIDKKLLKMCISLFNSPNIRNAFEE